MQADDMTDEDFTELMVEAAAVCDKFQGLLEEEELEPRTAFLAVAMIAAKCCTDMDRITPQHFAEQIETFVDSITEWEETQP